MVWGGGGGGGSGAVAQAAAAVAAGYAKYVVVFRALAQGQFGRFGQAAPVETISGPAAYAWPYGLFVPAQWVALRVRRFMHEHRVTQDALAAVVLADYHHAQLNPRAVMYGRPLTREQYDRSRWIVEPFHLYDCCMENDGAAALILTSAERARDAKQKPVYVMAAAQGAPHRAAAAAENSPDYASSHFRTLAPRLYEMAEIGPKDVDVVQIYEHFSGAVPISLVEHGFCEPDGVMESVPAGELHRAARQAPAQHQRRQYCRVLHARPRAGQRGGAPVPRDLDRAGARRQDRAGGVGPDGLTGERPYRAWLSVSSNRSDGAVSDG